MEFLRACEEAQRLGISLDDFRSIWEKENEVKLLELQSAQKVQAMNPEPNFSTSGQSWDHIERSLKGLFSNLLAEVQGLKCNFQTSLENQASINEKLMGEINGLRKHNCEQSREDKDQILNNGTARITLRPNHSTVAVQPARNFESHRATDIGSILAMPFSAILNSTPEVILTPLEISSCPTVVPAVRHPSVGSLYRDEVPADNIQNTNMDAPTAQELPGVVKTRAPPHRATMRRLSRHSSLVPTYSVNSARKEKVGDGLEVFPEENSLSEVKDRCKKDVKVEEDYIEKEVNAASAALEVKSEGRAHVKEEVNAEESAHFNKEVKPEQRAQVKKEAKAEERAQVKKEVKFQQRAQVKKEVKAEERVQVKKEVNTEERAHVKKEVKAKERAEAKKEVNVALASLGKMEVKSEERDQDKQKVKVEERGHCKKEVKAKELVKPGAQVKAGSKGTLFTADKRNNPHMLDVIERRHVVEGTEKHGMMQSPSDSSKVAEVRDDMDKRVVLKYKYIDNSGRIILDSLYPQCPLESDYFYTRGRKKCQVRLRFSFKEDNVLSVQLCVSHVPGVNEFIWPIFFDASGKVYNRETDKPSPLWTLKRTCYKPDRGEEKEMNANISLVTKSRSFQKVTFEMLQNLHFEIGNCFKFFWEVTTS